MVRKNEHLGISLATNKSLKYNEKDATAVRKHCQHQQHTANPDNFAILGNAISNYHLSLKESLLIFKLKPQLNIAKESMPLHLFDNDT